MATTKNKTAYLCLAAIVFLFFLLCPPPEGLDVKGMRAIGLLLATIIVWITNALPLLISSLLSISILSFLGVLSFGELCTAFGNQALFFMVAAFGVSAGLLKTKIPQRIISLVLKWSGTDSRKVVYGFLAGTALISSVMSDIPTCVIFSSIALMLLKANGDPKPGETALGRSLMIAVPCGAILGGFATPAGNGLNILIIDALDKATGFELSFVQWILVCLPMVIVLVLFCGWWIVRLFKPESIRQEALDEIRQQVAVARKWETMDIRFLVILGLMIIFWVASHWLPFVNITIVSIIGVAIMHLPHVRVLEDMDLVKSIRVDVLLTCGCIVALGTGIQASGAVSWVVDSLLIHMTAWPLVLVFLVISLIPCIVHTAIPVAGAIYVLTCVPLIGGALTLGLNPVAVALICAVWIDSVFLLPIDMVYLLTYGYHYYNMPQLIKFGWLPTLVCLAMTTLWIPFACSFMTM